MLSSTVTGTSLTCSGCRPVMVSGSRQVSDLCGTNRRRVFSHLACTFFALTDVFFHRSRSGFRSSPAHIKPRGQDLAAGSPRHRSRPPPTVVIGVARIDTCSRITPFTDRGCRGDFSRTHTHTARIPPCRARFGATDARKLHAQRHAQRWKNASDREISGMA